MQADPLIDWGFTREKDGTHFAVANGSAEEQYVRFVQRWVRLLEREVEESERSRIAEGDARAEAFNDDENAAEEAAKRDALLHAQAREKERPKEQAKRERYARNKAQEKDFAAYYHNVLLPELRAVDGQPPDSGGQGGVRAVRPAGRAARVWRRRQRGASRARRPSRQAGVAGDRRVAARAPRAASKRCATTSPSRWAKARRSKQKEKQKAKKAKKAAQKLGKATAPAPAPARAGARAGARADAAGIGRRARRR